MKRYRAASLLAGCCLAVTVGFLCAANCRPHGMRDRNTLSNSPSRPDQSSSDGLSAAFALTYGRPEKEAPAKGDTSLAELDALSERERSTGYVPGMGLAESALREQLGDYSGALSAAFKELYWAYSSGPSQLTKLKMVERLESVVPAVPLVAAQEVRNAVQGLIFFLEDNWSDALPILEKLADSQMDPDSYFRWLALVCRFGVGDGDRSMLAAYGSIRARYQSLPAYWYFLAKARIAAFQRDDAAAAAAERCVSLAPAGPFAAEAYEIMAMALGLSPAEGRSLRTRVEIEAMVGRSVSAGDPESLNDLFPLLALPDNPYTLYALGMLKALAGDSAFAGHFARSAGKARGRLSERLRFLSHG